MDYQYQQYRILKQIALAYAIKFVGRWLQHRFEEASAAAETGDFPADIVEVHSFILTIVRNQLFVSIFFHFVVFLSST